MLSAQELRGLARQARIEADKATNMIAAGVFRQMAREYDERAEAIDKSSGDERQAD